MLLWDAGLRRHGITTPLLLGDVILVCERLLLLERLGHVARVHLRVALGHAGARLLRGEVLRAGLLRGLDRASIVDTVLATAGGFRGVEASLEQSISDVRRVGGVVRCAPYLDQILALSLGDQRLELGGREGVDQPRLGDDEEKDLRAGQDRQLVCLQRDGEQLSERGCDDATRRRRRLRIPRTFFMMPALRFEKVMWRRDLSVMNLISIFLRSRPGLSSSSSSSSAVEGRWRLTPRFSPAALPFPTAWSSRAEGEAGSCWSVMSAMVETARAAQEFSSWAATEEEWNVRYDEGDSFEMQSRR